MTAHLTILVLLIACTSLRAAEDPFNPFAHIVRHGDTVVATLAPHQRWAVAVGSGHSRDALDGESFQLTDGEWLFLAELQDQRLIYRLRGHLSPLPAGVRVEQRFDAHTFTDMRVKKTYFIEAQ